MGECSLLVAESPTKRLPSKLADTSSRPLPRSGSRRIRNRSLKCSKIQRWSCTDNSTFPRVLSARTDLYRRRPNPDGETPHQMVRARLQVSTLSFEGSDPAARPHHVPISAGSSLDQTQLKVHRPFLTVRTGRSRVRIRQSFHRDPSKTLDPFRIQHSPKQTPEPKAEPRAFHITKL